MTKSAHIFKIESDHKEFHGYGTWFEVLFEGTDKTKSISLSTHPKEIKTHWRQDCWLFKEPFQIKKEDIIKLTIDVEQMKWKRHYTINVLTQIGEAAPFAREWAI